MNASPLDAEDTRPQPPSRFNPLAWWLTIAGLCTLILLCSFVILDYGKMSRRQAADPRPNFIGKLETDLEAVNRDGSEVSLGRLKGKIYVLGYQYTDCPSGCLGMAGIMKELHGEFGGREDFHLVSVSLQPDEDSPEKMDQWVRTNGVDAENWWFLTGEPERIRKYMSRYFLFFEATENTDPEAIAEVGKLSHDLRLVLIDGKANVRGYYGVMNATHGDQEILRLRRDIAYLFKEKS